MKQSLSELQTQVEAKSKVFGKFSPYPISCDDLLWLIKQVNAAQQSVYPTLLTPIEKIIKCPECHHLFTIHIAPPQSG